MSAEHDVRVLQSALLPVQDRARTLPWHKERAWTVDSHVFVDKQVPTIDLHDLSIKLGVLTVELLTQASGDLQCGAVTLITGRGRHSVDGRSRLREAVGEELAQACDDHGWSMRQGSPGRWILVLDDAAAPARASGRLEPWLVVAMVVFVGLTAWAVPIVGVPLAIALVAWGAWTVFSRSRRG